MSDLSSKSQTRVLSVFSLVMINVIAVDSLRTLPISAEYGFALVFYYAIAAVCFFIPTAFVTAELATAWPKTGGIYVWVREAFGKRWGFFVVWLQWIYNIVWYPTILSFVASMVAYLIDPALIEDKTFMVTALLILFWSATAVNFLGMKASSIVSTLGSILGTLLPMLLIIILGSMWYLQGTPIHIHMDAQHLLPHVDSLSDIVLVSGIMYGLVGLEMSAVHAQEVKRPERDYPRALKISVILILCTLMLSSLAVAMVVPQNELNLIAGILQAFERFFQAFHMPWMTVVIAMLMMLGGLSSVATWIIGPTKGMYSAAKDGMLPAWLAKTNKRDVPVSILLSQAVIYSLLALVYLYMPTVSSSYWLLTDLTAILALLMYVVMFAAAIYLRYRKPDVVRPYKIPFGNVGMWCVAGLGGLTSLLVVMIGFIPPTQVPIDNLWQFELLLVGGLALFCLPPFWIAKKS